MSKHHGYSVRCIIELRNGDGNFIEVWRGDKRDVAGLRDLESIAREGLHSFQSAIDRKSPVIPPEYPHRD